MAMNSGTHLGGWQHEMTKKPTFIKDEILMVVGAALTLFGMLALIGFSSRFDATDPGIIPKLLFTGLQVMGGIVLFGLGVRFRRLERRLIKLHSVVGGVDRIGIRELARSAGMSAVDARSGVIYLIGRGFIRHRFNPKRDLIYLSGDGEDREASSTPSTTDGYGAADAQAPRAAAGWTRVPAKCPSCGAPGTGASLIPAGSEPDCEYCGSRLVGEHVPPPEALQPAPAAGQPVEGVMTLALPLKAGSQVFNGSWFVLILLFIFFWPAAVAYLIAKVNKSGGSPLLKLGR